MLSGCLLLLCFHPHGNTLKGVGSLVGQPQLLVLHLGETGNWKKEVGGRGEGGREGERKGEREGEVGERWKKDEKVKKREGIVCAEVHATICSRQ